MLTLGANAQQKVVIGSDLEYGKTFKFSAELVEGDSIYVDWGDGALLRHSTKTSWGATANISGKLLSNTIYIYGALKTLEAKGDSISSLSFVDQTQLTRLDVSRNKLTNDGLQLDGLSALTSLTLDENRMVALNLMAFNKLESFSINNNPDFNTVVFADNNVVKNVSMNYCDVAHFYAKSMPELQYLSIVNGSLMDITIDEYYPKLSSLNLNGNRGIQSIDVTLCPELAVLELSNTAVTMVNTTKNPKLTTLKLDNTGVTSLTLTFNKLISNLYVSDTKLKKLDVSGLDKLRNIYIDNTEIARLDLTKKKYLSNVSASNTNIEFLDMHDEVGYNGLKLLDLRNNKKMTAQTLNYTFAAMPYHNGDSRTTNVFIKGVPGASTSNTDIITDDYTNYYKVDVEGDGSAPMDSVNITIPNVIGGAISLKQVGKNGVDESWHTIINKAMPGYPVSVTATPTTGYEYAGIKVNGQLYEDTIFVVSSDATVMPVFTKVPEQVIKLTVSPGEIQQYYLAGTYAATPITVDWGDGEPVPYIIGLGSTSIANETGTVGTTVTITGAVEKADFTSYPGFGVDNKITGIDVSGNSILKSLELYKNEIETLDVSNLKELETLDCSYCELEELDVTENHKLKQLKAYGNYIEEIDVTGAPDLEILDVKGNYLTELNTLANTKLKKLDAQSNELTSLNTGSMYNLEELYVSNNSISSLDLKDNNKLRYLNVAKNKLSRLDVDNMLSLQSLIAYSNKLEGLDLSNQKYLTTLQVGDNNWDACTLNDMYYSLNKYPELQDKQTATGYTLLVSETGAEHENDYAHAESDIAIAKGWSVNHDGDGTGCSLAYVTIMDTNNGDVKLFTEDNVEVKSGDKVTKNTVLTLDAVPAAGYKVASAKANGVAIADNKFTVAKATDVLVKFSVTASIEGIGKVNVSVEGGDHEIIVAADKTLPIVIYSIKGAQMYSGNIKDKQAIGLPSGLYIVKVAGTSKKILVK